MGVSFPQFQPFHRHEAFHGLKFRIAGKNAGILLYGNGDHKCIRKGKRMVCFDMGGGKH